MIDRPILVRERESAGADSRRSDLASGGAHPLKARAVAVAEPLFDGRVCVYAPAVASDTVVFIPAWNEERALPGVLDELHAGLPAADVLVIDDGSTDATAEVAAAGGAIVVSFGENRGLRAGIAPRI